MKSVGLKFVAAPVFGRPSVAEAGKLWVAAAGPEEDVAIARPASGADVAAAFLWWARSRARRTRVKLGGNFLISAMIHALGEAFVYAEGQGIAPETFLETVNSALFQSPFYAAYGKVMLHPPETAGRDD